MSSIRSWTSWRIYTKRARRKVILLLSVDEVDISKIDPQAAIADSSSLLELMILAIMKHFSLSSKESVALLSNESRYLAHILAKGFKTEFRPVENLLKELLDNIDLLHQFCAKNKENEQFLLRSVKPSLISKSDSVVKLGLKLFNLYIQKTHSDSAHAAHRFTILKEFLLSTLMLGIKRHPHLTSMVLDFILLVAGTNDGLLVSLKH